MPELVEETYDLESKCLLRVWPNISKDEDQEEPFCSAVWDSVYCWPPTASGVLIQRSCSEIFQESYSQYAGYLEGNVERECLPNGSWAQGNSSNYDECATSFYSYLNDIEEDNVLVPLVHHMLFVGSILSIICLGTTIAIFQNFRCLRCDRVAVQIQLMLSLSLRFALMFVIAEPNVISHSSSYRDSDLLCKTILVLFLYSTFASISWMCVQGLFLNVTLMAGVVTISPRYQFTIFYMIGWGVPALFVGVFTVTLFLRNTENCWMGYSDMSEIWIILGPIILELLINGAFLLNILRILMRKVRNSNSRPDDSQFKAAVKATAILFPVLGINNLVLLYNPGGDYNKYFVMLNTFFGSTQGIFIGIVFCFADKEVWAAVRRGMKRVHSRRFGRPRYVRNTIRVPREIEMSSRNENIHCNGIVLEESV